MIDQERLKELEQDFGAEDLGEILEMFLGEAADVLDRISEGAGEAQGDLLHFLKGCANNVGAVELASLCQTIEESGGMVGDAELASLKQTFAQVQMFFADPQALKSA